MIWAEPVTAHLLSLPACQSSVTHYCQHGTRWRKNTRFAGWCVRPLPRALGLRCSGRHGVCNKTGQGHINLQGSAPGGKRWTAIAEPYPSCVASNVAQWLLDSADSIEHARTSMLLNKLSG